MDSLAFFIRQEAVQVPWEHITELGHPPGVEAGGDWEAGLCPASPA